MQSKPVKMPNIILVEDHLIFRQGIKAIINFENLGTVIGEASNGKDFIKLITASKPDLVLMDIEMPDMNGIEATRNALEINPDLRVIAFSGYADEDYYFKMVELGAKGFILKTEGLKELEIAILKVMQGERYFSCKLNHSIENALQDDTNTETENANQLNIKDRKMMFFPWISSRVKIKLPQDN